MRGSTRISKGLFALAVTVAFGIATGASAETETAGQTIVAKGAAKKTGKKKHGKGGKKAKAAAVEAQESDVVVGAALVLGGEVTLVALRKFQKGILSFVVATILGDALEHPAVSRFKLVFFAFANILYVGCFLTHSVEDFLHFLWISTV